MKQSKSLLSLILITLFCNVTSLSSASIYHPNIITMIGSRESGGTINVNLDTLADRHSTHRQRMIEAKINNYENYLVTSVTWKNPEGKTQFSVFDDAFWNGLTDEQKKDLCPNISTTKIFSYPLANVPIPPVPGEYKGYPMGMAPMQQGYLSNPPIIPPGYPLYPAMGMAPMQQGYPMTMAPMGGCPYPQMNGLQQLVYPPTKKRLQNSTGRQTGTALEQLRKKYATLKEEEELQKKISDLERKKADRKRVNDTKNTISSTKSSSTNKQRTPASPGKKEKTLTSNSPTAKGSSEVKEKTTTSKAKVRPISKTEKKDDSKKLVTTTNTPSKSQLRKLAQQKKGEAFRTAKEIFEDEEYEEAFENQKYRIAIEHLKKANLENQNVLKLYARCLHEIGGRLDRSYSLDLQKSYNGKKYTPEVRKILAVYCNLPYEDRWRLVSHNSVENCPECILEKASLILKQEIYTRERANFCKCTDRQEGKRCKHQTILDLLKKHTDNPKIANYLLYFICDRIEKDDCQRTKRKNINWHLIEKCINTLERTETLIGHRIKECFIKQKPQKAALTMFKPTNKSAHEQSLEEKRENKDAQPITALNVVEDMMNNPGDGCKNLNPVIITYLLKENFKKMESLIEEKIEVYLNIIKKALSLPYQQEHGMVIEASALQSIYNMITILKENGHCTEGLEKDFFDILFDQNYNWDSNSISVLIKEREKPLLPHIKDLLTAVVNKQEAHSLDLTIAMLLIPSCQEMCKTTTEIEVSQQTRNLKDLEEICELLDKAITTSPLPTYLLTKWQATIDTLKEECKQLTEKSTETTL